MVSDGHGDRIRSAARERLCGVCSSVWTLHRRSRRRATAAPGRPVTRTVARPPRARPRKSGTRKHSDRGGRLLPSIVSSPWVPLAFGSRRDSLPTPIQRLLAVCHGVSRGPFNCGRLHLPPPLHASSTPEEGAIRVRQPLHLQDSSGSIMLSTREHLARGVRVGRGRGAQGGVSGLAMGIRRHVRP